MNVSELAREAGIAPSAVRWYEETGVLPAPHRRSNGYREYGSGDLARLRLVVALRRLGLAPPDAGRLAGLCLEGGAADMALAPFLARQRAAIDRQRAELDRLDAELVDLGDTIAAAGRAAASRAAASRVGSGVAAADGAAATGEDTMTDQPIRVLFVCTGNSARSQMAEAMLAAYGHDEFQVFSAGTEPRGVNPFAVQVLAEMGIDWSAARSKSVTEFLGRPFDYVITVCDRARQACPVFPGQHNSLHWGLDDPAEVEGSEAQKLAAFRRTQTELGARLRPFIELARRARREAAAV